VKTQLLLRNERKERNMVNLKDTKPLIKDQGRSLRELAAGLEKAPDLFDSNGAQSFYNT
jgi:hypothetical protein